MAILKLQQGSKLNYTGMGIGLMNNRSNPNAETRIGQRVASYPIKSKVYTDEWINDPKTQDAIVGSVIGSIHPGTGVAKINSTSKLSSTNIISKIKDKLASIRSGTPSSEINWGAWNKEIPVNKPLVNEYNTIERATKANGTWMKNPDGTIFPGSKEQFIQMQSKNFKDAFGNTAVLVNGRPQILTHNSPANFDTFKLDSKSHGRLSGDGVYTFEEGARWEGMPEHVRKTLRYPGKDMHFKHYGDIEYNLYGNSTNPMIGKGQFDDITKDQIISNSTSTRVLDKIGGQNVHVFPNTQQLKSAVGNNGMFDMTNPNIYKGIIPAAVVGSAALTRTKKSGGLLTK